MSRGKKKKGKRVGRGRQKKKKRVVAEVKVKFLGEKI